MWRHELALGDREVLGYIYPHQFHFLMERIVKSQLW